jgi:DNA-binding transcriptional ArsR family regulator
MLSDLILEALKQRPMTARELRFRFNTQEEAISSALAMLIGWDYVESVEISSGVFYAIKKPKKVEKETDSGKDHHTLDFKKKLGGFREDVQAIKIVVPEVAPPVSTLCPDALSYEEWARIVEEESIERVSKTLVKKIKQ